MIEIKRRKGESSDGMLRRFSKNVRQSGTLIQKRKIAFLKKPLSKGLKKAVRLYRVDAEEKREFLRKTGQLSPDELKYKKRRK